MKKVKKEKPVKPVKIKKTIWDKIKESATDAAKTGRPVSDCPYIWPAFRGKWLDIYQNTQQQKLF